MNGPNEDKTLQSIRSTASRGQTSGGFTYIDSNGQIIGQLPQGYIVGQQFRVRNTLGEGGMSYVYLCDDISLNRQVALKVMRAGAQSNDQAFMRFHREGQAVAMLSHPNVVKVHSLQFTEHDQPFLVMEVVQGVPLSQLIEVSGPLKLPRAIKFISQICDGISHAHENGVIHRDLKLSNLMLLNPNTENESIKILDFGIAKVVTETSVKMTQTGEVFGSPAYMSPEQALGKSVDEKTDQYSLGCIAFELLTGRTPFAAENYLAVLMAHVQDEAPSVNEFAKVPMPPQIERTIARLLSKNPQDRFASIDEVKKAFHGDIKVNKPHKKAITTKIDRRYITYGLGALACAGIIGAITYLTRPTPSPAPLVREEKLEEKDNIFDVANSVSDDGFLYGLINEDKTRTTFGDQLCKRDISDNELTYLTQVPNLKELKLNNCSKLTDAGVATIARNSSIKHLELNRTKITDAGLASIATMKNLQNLSLEEVYAITDKGISDLSKLEHLTILHISGNPNLTGECLKDLAKLKDLSYLHIDNDGVSAGLPYLAHTRLIGLSLSGSDATSKSLRALLSIRSLADLSLEKIPVDDDTLLGLAKMPHLRRLDLKQCTLSRNLITQFHKINPECELVYEKSHVEQ